MDVVVLHSLQNMSNFAGDEGYGVPASGVMSMKANGTLVNACLDEFINNYRGDLWSHNGPQAITRALNNNCKRKTANSWETVMEPLFSIPRHEWQIYFEETNDIKIDELINNSMAIHVWNKLSAKRFVKVGSNTLYSVHASKYCPVSHWSSYTFF
ncbi:hypothetical protein J437_LFUL019091 [Ladona fulva]|uniref:Alpha 1,4-glycosyltransferase domain-containing protein n=1 Tax=Ladona fulva TaxID=123851 RepID=A0A8K0KQ16_LADFU|nr:hypothetical protein J437_LFUL019091 [Ladona fulva]